MKFLRLQLALICAFSIILQSRQAKADTIELVNGNQIRNVTVVRMSGGQVLIRFTDGHSRNIAYAEIKNIVYAAISVPSSTPPLTSMAIAPTLSSNEAFAVIQKQWDQLDSERSAIQAELVEVDKSIRMATAKTEGNKKMDANETDQLNALLKRRSELEVKYRGICNKQEVLRKNVLELADTVSLHNKESTVSQTDSHSPSGITLLPVVLPGWRQYRETRYPEAAFLALGLAYALNSAYDARSHYEYFRQQNLIYNQLTAGFLLVGNSDASLQSNGLTRVQAQNAKKYMRKYDTALWMIGGIYALNLWDISIEGGVRTYLSARPSLEGLRFGVVFLF